MGTTTFSGPVKSGPVISGSTSGGYRGLDLKDTNWVKNSFVHYFQEPTALDANGICTSQSRTGAGNLTLNGALTATINGNSVYAPSVSGTAATADGAWARRISITSSGDDRTVTYTVYGTDINGKALSEAVTGPNATETQTANTLVGIFKSVTKITTSASTVGNITVGIAGAASDLYARAIGILPYQSSLLNVKIHVTEVFNSTADPMEIGKSDDQDYLADVASARTHAAAAVAEGNQVDVDATQATAWMSVSQSDTGADSVAYNSDVQVTALLIPTGTLATTGKAWLELEFMQAKNLASGDTW
jgi:hypothetical protein